MHLTLSQKQNKHRKQKSKTLLRHTKKNELEIANCHNQASEWPKSSTLSPFHVGQIIDAVPYSGPCAYRLAGQRCICIVSWSKAGQRV